MRVALPEPGLQHRKACERLHPAALRASQIGRSGDMGTPVILITGALTGIGRAAALAFARFGRLDAAVNNAGTEGQPGPVTQQTADTYAATFDPNVLGTLLSMKHELRVMQAQGSGSIVNISSTYGHEGAAGAS